MVPLIRAAQHGGHDVVVSSGRDMAALIDQLGVAAHPSGLTLAESYERMPEHSTVSERPAEEQPAFSARHLFGAAIADAGLSDPIADVLGAPYLEICPPSLRGTEANPWTVTHHLRPSPGEIDSQVSAGMDFSTLPHPHTVYVTLGTIMNQAPAVFRAVIDGCARWPVNLVVTTGPGFDQALLGPLSPAVRIASFLPQAAVLPRCRAVVSHAGAGTMLGALCYGLPQLCLPQAPISLTTPQRCCPPVQH